MTEFKTDISENGKMFELVFQTDNKAYFEKMQATARECIDHKPVTQFDRIKAMSVEQMADYFAYMFDCNLCSEQQRLSDNPLLEDERCDNNCMKHCKQWLEQEVSE